jgi:hypothetical protein
MSGLQRSNEVCGGPAGLLDGRLDTDRAGPLLYMELAGARTQAPDNTILMPFDDAPRRYHVRARDGRRLAEGSTSTRACFGDFASTRDASVRLGRPIAGLRLQAPLLYASPAMSSDQVHVYSQLRLSHDDALFIRISPEPVARAGWVTDGIRLYAADPTFLGNHQCYYRKCLAGQEAEHKFTLTGEFDVWALTAEIYEELRRGSLPGFVMEYGDEFQRWDYENHLFEVLAPESERGYIAFIPTTDGRFTLKRKWYTDDALVRREHHERGVVVPGRDFERYLAERLPVQVRRLPSFRRVRYDVNFESLHTGHVYGAFFDHCPLLDAPHISLSQCEVEYLRSRVAIAPDEQAVLPELAAVATWVERFLLDRGVTFERTHYSKLSFLRDAVARLPSLGLGS